MMSEVNSDLCLPPGSGPARVYSGAPVWVMLLVIAAITAAAFAGGAGGPFVFDDSPELVQNPDIRSFVGCLDTISRSSDTGLAGRPAACASFALNYALGGLDVRGFHLLNILIHVLAALTLFGVLRRTLERLHMAYGAGMERPLSLEGESRERGPFRGCADILPSSQPSRLSGKSGTKHALSTHHNSLALCITVLWAVHPLQTESVTYIIQRIESLAGLWYLLTLYCVVRSSDGTWTAAWKTGAVVCCAIGMLTKEILVSAPIAVLLYDVCCLSGSFGVALRRNRWLNAGLAATWLIPVVLLSRSPRGGTVGFDLGVSPFDYLRTQAGVIIYYLRLCLYPHPLAISYSDWPIVREWRSALVPGAAVLVLLAVSTMGVARRRLWGLAGAFFFLVLSCSSSFIPIVTEPAAERRMYLPLAAVIGVVVALSEHGITRLLQSFEVRPGTRSAIKIGISSAVAGLLMVSTVMRNADYKSAERLLSKTLAVRPGDELVRGALIEELVQQRRFGDARSIQAEGLAGHPMSYILYENWGRSMMSAGRFDEALAAFDKALEIRPNDARARSGAGAALAEQGRWPEAVEQLRAALRLHPGAYRAHGNLGVALANSGHVEEAIAEMREALRLKPTFVEGQFNLGRLLLDRGEISEAVQCLSAALQSAPQDTEIMLALAEALAKDGRNEDAVRQYRAVLARRPANDAALSALRQLGVEHE